MIGQDMLKEQFEKMIAEDRLPHFIMLVGDRGQGKRTFAHYVSAIMQSAVYQPNELKVDDIRELAEDSYTLTKKRLYLLADSDGMTAQAQNALLKFIEEPSSRAYIIMTVEHLDNVLSTIKSRASVFRMELYKKEHLKQFTQDEILLQVCSNIGEIERMQSIEFTSMLKTSETVIESISSLSSANTFNILKHFNIDDSDLFLKFLLLSLERKLQVSGMRMIERMKLVKQIRVIFEHKKQLNNKSINKQNTLEMMFLKMREVSQ